MNKIFAIALGAAFALIGASPAFAATIPASTVFNGQTDTWGNGGSSVTATFRVNVAAGEVVHAIRTKVDSQATVCTAVGPFEGAQDVDVPVTITLPPNTNNSGYNLTAELFTTNTIPQAEALTGNLACTGMSTTAYNGSNVVHVLPVSGNSTSGSSTGTTSQFDQLMAMLTALVHPTPAPVPTPVVPVVSSACSQLTHFMAGAVQGVRNSANIKLQGFLLSQGMEIPALAAGAAFGFYGPQTGAALVSFESMNQCTM
jgi:hypothetical protein